MTCPRDLAPHPVLSWGEAAKRLGVSKSHLWKVINGKRQSEALQRRYDSLINATQRHQAIDPNQIGITLEM